MTYNSLEYKIRWYIVALQKLMQTDITFFDWCTYKKALWENYKIDQGYK